MARDKAATIEKRERIAKGICFYCGKEPAMDDEVLCKKCFKRKEHLKAWVETQNLKNRIAKLESALKLAAREYLESIEHEGCCDFCPAVDADRDCNHDDCIQSVVNMWLEHKVFGGPYGLEDTDGY